MSMLQPHLRRMRQCSFIAAEIPHCITKWKTMARIHKLKRRKMMLMVIKAQDYFLIL